MYKTLVLSGCAVNGFITLGALQKINDSGNLLDNVNTYIGTSSGSIINCLLSVGYTPIELLAKMCSEHNLRNVGKPNVTNLLLGNGLLSFQSIRRCVEDLLIEKIGYVPTLGQLKARNNITMICTTLNFSKSSREYLSYQTYPDLLVTQAIEMSSSFPFIFSPCRYNDDLYVDGGLADNFPILLSQQYEGKALGIYVTTEVNNTNRSLDLMTLPSLFIIHFNLVCMDHIYTTIQDCIVISKPPGGFFNFQVSDDEIMAMFDLGYKECRVPGGCC